MSIFNKVAVRKPNRSKFDLSHDVKMSFNPGELVPCAFFDVVPGDKINISAQSLVRFAPLISPLMHRVDAHIEYFFVPYRLLWPDASADPATPAGVNGWESFISSTKIGDTVPAIPQVHIPYGVNPALSRLPDYLGIPPNHGDGAYLPLTAFPFAAYQMIWNEYYRQQYVQDEVPFKLSSGYANNDINDLLPLRQRSWPHDYFTSCLPFPQKNEDVLVPLGDVELKDGWYNAGSRPFYVDKDGTRPQGNDATHSDADAVFGSDASFPIDTWNGGLTSTEMAGHPVDDPRRSLAFDPDGSLTTSPITINELRRAESLQTYLELLARGGSRFIEVIKNFFNVSPGDARLQRPEYIYGIKTPVQISEVLNTTGNSGELPQGNMAGHGAAVIGGKAGSYFVREHGLIMGLISVVPQTSYMNGVEKYWMKTDPLEFFWPQFEGLGEQPVVMREIYCDTGTDGNAYNVFGYLPRYAEYKSIPSRVAGDFRTTLKYWTWARSFDTQPLLTSDFITCVPDNDIYAVTDPDAQKLYVHVFNLIKASRPMKKYTIPRL